MNWEAIGAIAELVGAIGVVASLVYLARQIGHSNTQMRQNTRALELAALDASTEQGLEIRKFIFGSEALTEIWLQGCDDYHSLDLNSRARFGAVAEGLFFGWQATHSRVAVGALYPELFEGQLPMIGQLLSRPGLATWWERRKGLFGPSFVQAIEAERRRTAA